MVDVAIIGQGLAGTALAWRCVWRGLSVLLVDWESAEGGATSSRVAAGLITPITGKRLAKTPRIDEAFPAAVEFYRRVEVEIGESVFFLRRIVRLFLSEEERNVYRQRQASEFLGWVAPNEPVLDPDIFTAPLGSFEMTPAAQLMTAAYLDRSRAWFHSRGMYRTAGVEMDGGIVPGAEAVVLPGLGVSARQVVICEGFPARPNPWFPTVRFEAAKGEILTLRAPGLHEERIINRGGTWLAPIGGGLYRAGSTYDRDNLDAQPTAVGREEILRKLSAFLRLGVEVIDHQAGVRPITEERAPVIRRHSHFPRLGYINGLHSKGSLFAPLIAAEFLIPQE